MAIAITLVAQGKNNLRYLAIGAGADTGVITSTGAASPDLATDSLQGPIKKMSAAFTSGYGTLAAGALTQAQSRAIWMNDNTGPTNIGNSRVPRAQAILTPRTGATGAWFMDANVDGGGHPTITCACAAAASAYIDIQVVGTIGA